MSPLQTEDPVAGLRLATTEDAERIVPFINRAFAPDNYFKRTERTNPSQVAEYLRKGFFLLLEDAVGLFGLVYTELRANSRGYIGMIATDPDRQAAESERIYCGSAKSSAATKAPMSSRSPSSISGQILLRGISGRDIESSAKHPTPPCHFILMEKCLTPTTDADSSN
jgi:hypothetical protein